MPAKSCYLYSREWYEVDKSGHRLFYATPFYFDNEDKARRSWQASQTMTWVEHHHHEPVATDLLVKVGMGTPRVLLASARQQEMSRERVRTLRAGIGQLAKKFGAA